MKLVMVPPHKAVVREWAERLRADVDGLEVVIPEDLAQAGDALADADAAYGTLPESLLLRAERLRWLQAPHAAPAAGYYHDALVAHPVVVTNMRGIYSDHIGVHVMACLLALARDLPHYAALQAARIWRPRPLDEGVIHVGESTLLIVGLGGVGAEVARLAEPFGLRILATDARRTDRPAGIARLRPAGELDSLLPLADFVLVTVPDTPETRFMFDADRFARMKPGSFFLNVGRGLTTRIDDLDAALARGHLRGAALDVFEHEPLPADHLLWTRPNTILTPHISAYGPYLPERRYAVFRDNCRAFISGKPLQNVVDKARWF